MDFELSNEQKDIQRAVREFAKGKFDKDVILELERNHQFPWDIWKEACQLGFIGINFPEEYGGQSYGLLEWALVCEELCRDPSGIGLALSGSILGAGLILKYGTEHQKQKYITPITRGETLSALGITEPDHGSDIISLDTTAIKEGNNYIINGTKIFITNGALAKYVVTLCQTDPEAKPSYHGQSTIIIEADCPGFEATDLEKIGMNMSSTAQISLTNVIVPQENLVGEENLGFYQALGHINEMRVQVAAGSLGIAQGAFDMALDYAKNRRAFGHRIADFQTIQHKLAEMATKIETARLLTYKAAWNYDNNIIEPKIFSMAKWYSARVAVEVVDEAIEIWGGHGYMVENVIGLAYRNARVLEIVEGTKEIHKNLIAHALLSGRL